MTADNFFKSFKYKKEDIENYVEKANEDLQIARDSDTPKVKTLFSYNALIKLGIAGIAYKKRKRVRSKRGHHIKILEGLSDILDNKDVSVIGHTIRKKRNSDLYFADSVFTEKESQEYFNFVQKIYKKVKALIKDT